MGVTCQLIVLRKRKSIKKKKTTIARNQEFNSALYLKDTFFKMFISKYINSLENRQFHINKKKQL